ncbi:CsbD family protein [Micromonospora sp. 4G55]|uniref:CsbD family protein n=1 Tax=Micromonospora sp. 4G55 TaxID=2806102 RepID=UPI001A58B0A0|nr:CsbD family protein [Micromonospora sp. 4G55]MBM0256205.1 CsbD family protein [Micromonospora sp. 4G55]
MSFTEKAKNKAQQLTGVAKERIGDVTDNEPMRGEGATEQSTARARQTGGDPRDARRRARDTFR